MQAQKYSIKNWSPGDRPREKLLSKSASLLTDSELIAIIINNGSREKNAVDLAREILQLSKNNLVELGKLSIREIMKVKGVGIVKAATLSAALELGRRRQETPFPGKTVIKESKDVASYLQALLRDHKREVFVVIFLNRGHKVNHIEVISEGGMTGTVADPRLILRKALEENAVNLILCHNHPSGNLRPSKADEELTVKIREAARFFDIKVLDHLIVSDEGYFSFADEGLM